MKTESKKLPPRAQVKADHVLDIVERYTGITRADISSSSRKAEIAFARHLAGYIMANYYKITFHQTARVLGMKNHTTIFNLIDKIDFFIDNKKIYPFEANVIKDCFRCVHIFDRRLLANNLADDYEYTHKLVTDYMSADSSIDKNRSIYELFKALDSFRDDVQQLHFEFQNDFRTPTKCYGYGDIITDDELSELLIMPKVEIYARVLNNNFDGWFKIKETK